MKLHRFIGPYDFGSSKISITDPETIHQIRKVLRLNPNEQIILSDGNLGEATVKLIIFEKDKIEGEIIEKYKNKNEPERKVVLYTAILKRENFDLVVQKATETGVKEIIPVITSRTVKTGLNLDRLRKIAKEAAEQSGRGIVPVIHEPIKFQEAIKNGGILFDPSGDILKAESLKLEAKLFVGPEGGFTEEEIELAKKNNFKIASLGSLTLRAETAAIIGSYLAITS